METEPDCDYYGTSRLFWANELAPRDCPCRVVCYFLRLGSGSCFENRINAPRRKRSVVNAVRYSEEATLLTRGLQQDMGEIHCSPWASCLSVLFSGASSIL